MRVFHLFLSIAVCFAVVPSAAFAENSAGLQARLDKCRRRLQDSYAAAAPSQEIASVKSCVARLHRRVVRSGHGQTRWVWERVQTALDSVVNGTAEAVFEPSAAVRMRKRAPSQAQMNKIVSDFFGSSFEGENCVANCAAIQGDMKSGIQQCQDGGTVKVKVAKCNSNGIVIFRLKFNKCRAGGKVRRGGSSLAFAVQPPWLGTRMKSTGFIKDGFKLKTNGVYVYNKCINGKYSRSMCTGWVYSGGRYCKMTKNCQKCRY